MEDKSVQTALKAVANASSEVEQCMLAIQNLEADIQNLKAKMEKIESDGDNFKLNEPLYSALNARLEKANVALDKREVALDKAKAHHLKLLQICAETSKQSSLRKRNLDSLRSIEEIAKDTAAPSEIAKTGGQAYLKKYCREIDCHRTSFDSKSLPITLMHPVFAEFVQNYKTIRPNNESCLFAYNFRQEMLKDYVAEADMAEMARYHLGEFLGIEIPVVTVSKSVSDGSLRVDGMLILNLEVKLRPGVGGDPAMQNFVYFMKHLPKSINHQLPCFLLDISGPLLGVYGVMNTDECHVICEPLCQGIMLHDVQNDLIRPIVPCAFAALKIAIRSLRNMATTKNMRGLTPFPYKTSCQINGSDVTFCYLENITRKVFLVEYNGADGSTIKAVAKFTSKYGREVHEYCANFGFAPKLLAFEELPAGWKFVLMEYIDLESIAKIDRLVKQQQLNRILEGLRQKNFVHGDLRETNVFWNRLHDKVCIIDFDWSGKNGIERYPMDMNPDIRWPPGATTDEVLMYEHDAFWINTLLENQT